MRSSYLFVFLFLSISILSCRKEAQFTTDGSAVLRFSTDTVLFDTVFTSVGSTTRRLQVFNPNKKAVKISDIRLAGGATSPYKLNIDGLPTDAVQDYELAGNDSMYIFVKVNINPTAVNMPFIVEDSILFTTNGNLQKVQLAAYGQNANFLTDSVLQTDQTWDNTLPYIIYGTGVLVDTAVTLTISKGARVYFHRGAQLFVSGTLRVNGVLGDSVIFQGDRLEQIYVDEPGQWNSIQFLPPSNNNRINYAVIKNAVFGVIAGTIPADPNLDVTIQNSVIKHMTVTGIFGINATVRSYNNLLYNCGQYAFFGAYGGNYDLKHTTVANFTQANFSRTTPSVVFTDYLQEGLSPLTNTLQAILENNIIWGNLEEEFEAVFVGTPGTIGFENNLVRTKKTNLPANNILNKNPLFVQEGGENYHLKNTTSPAYQKATKLQGVVFATDLDGKVRPAMPTIGCYEVE